MSVWLFWMSCSLSLSSRCKLWISIICSVIDFSWVNLVWSKAWLPYLKSFSSFVASWNSYSLRSSFWDISFTSVSRSLFWSSTYWFELLSKSNLDWSSYCWVSCLCLASLSSKSNLAYISACSRSIFSLTSLICFWFSIYIVSLTRLTSSLAYARSPCIYSLSLWLSYRREFRSNVTWSSYFVFCEASFSFVAKCFFKSSSFAFLKARERWVRALNWFVSTIWREASAPPA